MYFAIIANNSDLLEKLEELLQTWSKQIEQVLAESEQIRREADDIGPSAELLYWKSRMAKFNTYAILSLYSLIYGLFNINPRATHANSPISTACLTMSIIL